MRALFFYLMIVIITSCKEKCESKTYTENKASLAVKEQSHAETFLKIFADDKRNLFGATVIKGKIVNSASVCGYKNTRIKMLCYHNNIRVEEHEDILPDIIKPGASQNFKTKYHIPKNTDSIALTIMNAEAILIDTLKQN